MQVIKTFYQLYDNEDVICCIDGVLVSLSNGCEVWFNDKVYIVRETVDVIKSYKSVYRTIWLVEGINENEEEY